MHRVVRQVEDLAEQVEDLHRVVTELLVRLDKQENSKPPAGTAAKSAKAAK